eukprot:gb/GECG01009681.1/.p1 GENE.gb/GECG01009681.1/~~gb/GECG01009681.1/.p1  ORF type:complete len:283 (+),score=22.04 gb/GECG01009681.1/:1-849(+)
MCPKLTRSAANRPGIERQPYTPERVPTRKAKLTRHGPSTPSRWREAHLSVLQYNSLYEYFAHNALLKDVGVESVVWKKLYAGMDVGFVTDCIWKAFQDISRRIDEKDGRSLFASYQNYPFRKLGQSVIVLRVLCLREDITVCLIGFPGQQSGLLYAKGPSVSCMDTTKTKEYILGKIYEQDGVNADFVNLEGSMIRLKWLKTTTAVPEESRSSMVDFVLGMGDTVAHFLHKFPRKSQTIRQFMEFRRQYVKQRSSGQFLKLVWKHVNKRAVTYSVNDSNPNQ